MMINYPNKKKITTNASALSTARGMNLEKDIQDSNTYYQSIDKAAIYKKPTPIQVVKVDYPARKYAKICEAYYQTPSTTDFNGIYRGKYIDFEAKETKSKSLFTLQNIHAHQIEHLAQVLAHGAIAFVIIRFTSFNETYLLDASYIVDAYQTKEKKSLTYKEITQHAHLIREGFTPRLKYLDIVDLVYFKED